MRVYVFEIKRYDIFSEAENGHPVCTSPTSGKESFVPCGLVSAFFGPRKGHCRRIPRFTLFRADDAGCSSRKLAFALAKSQGASLLPQETSTVSAQYFVLANKTCYQQFPVETSISRSRCLNEVSVLAATALYSVKCCTCITEMNQRR